MQHAESDNRPAGQQSKKHNRLAAAHRIGQQPGRQLHQPVGQHSGAAEQGQTLRIKAKLSPQIQ